MSRTILYISLCLVLPMILLCFYLEKRARRIVVSMICGMFSCFVAFLFEGFLFDILPGKVYLNTVVIAPMLEEALKLVSVGVVALIVKKGKRGSAANAFSVGVGFCVTENFCYLVSNIETANIFWIIIRSIGTGLMHCMSATVIGMGVYFARKNEKYRPFCVFGALACAVLFHGLYNFLVRFNYLRIVAALLPLTLFMLFFVLLKGTELHNYLCEKE